MDDKEAINLIATMLENFYGPMEMNRLAAETIWSALKRRQK